MRVLVLTHNYPRHAGDPVGSFVHRLVRGLETHDIQAHVLAPSAPDVPAHDVIDGIPVTRFRYAPRKLETLAYTGTMGAQVRQFWKARLAMVGFLAAAYRGATRIMNAQPIDVVHAHWWFPGGLVARAVRARTGIPYVVTMHGSDIRLAAAAPGAATLFRAVSHRAATMTTVSTWLAREAQRLDPQLAPVVAPMPIHAELFHPGQPEPGPQRLLFIGKLTEQKGLHHLLRAMSMMRERPALDVVGAGRVADEQFRKLAVDLGVDARITWHPLLSQEALATLYRRAAVHVVPAVEEGLGMTAIESLLSGTPVVAFDSGGLPDMVVHERTGLLVRAGDAQGLAGALDRVLTDATLRRRLGSDGRTFALDRFGPETVAERYAGVLRSAAIAR